MSEIEKEMVERVARAICKAQGKNPDDPLYVRYPGPAVGGAAWRGHEDDARAAIAEMLEPTEAMDQAGFDAADADYDVTIAMSTPGRIWRAMIDEALK